MLDRVEERATVSRRSVERGRVRVIKRVVEDEKEIELPTVRESVRVERVPVGELVDVAPQTRREGDTLIVPVVDEVLVVEKRLRLREELHLHTERHAHTETRTITVRREEIEVERLPPQPASRTRRNIMAKTVIGLYDSPEAAETALQALESEGFDRVSMTLMAEQGHGTTSEGAGTAGHQQAPTFLRDRGVPQDDAEVFAEAVRRGASMVVVETDERHAERAGQILDANRPIDADRLAQRWREAGWERHDPAAAPLAGEERDRELREAAEYEVVEEDVKVGTRAVEHGGVRVRTFVTERPVQETVRLRDERVHVEREPVDEVVDPARADEAFTEEAHEIRETGEEPVVSKEARVVERVRVDKDTEVHEEDIEDTERRRDVEVERFDDRPGHHH